MRKFGTENSTTEFKWELNDALEKEVVAFLNSAQGGDLYIGVDDDVEVAVYDRSIVHISEHFFKLCFPMDARALEIAGEAASVAGAESEQVTPEVTAQVTAQVGAFCQEPHSAREIMEHLGLRHWKTFQQNYLNPLLDAGFIERTLPDKPQSRLQKYRLTEVGRQWLKISGRGK